MIESIFMNSDGRGFTFDSRTHNVSEYIGGKLLHKQINSAPTPPHQRLTIEKAAANGPNHLNVQQTDAYRRQAIGPTSSIISPTSTLSSHNPSVHDLINKTGAVIKHPGATAKEFFHGIGSEFKRIF